jgi:hypothetical protein
MPLQDLILLHLDDADRDQALSLLEQLRQLLQPKLQSLTPEERQRYGSIGEENKKLVNKVRDLIEEDPSGVPEMFDIDEFKADFKDRRILEAIRSRMESLLFEIESTKILHDNDNYKDTLAYYQFQVFRHSIGAPQAEGRVEQMKQFFATLGRRTNNNTPTNNNDTPA